MLYGPTLGCDDRRVPSVEPPSEQPASASTGRTPEIVLLVSLDTLRADALGTYGYDRFTSPVLDAFAAGGVVFEDASSTAPWTLPAHASMFTGLHPKRHGALTTATALSPDVPTLASVLERAGWQTAAVVSTVWLERDAYGLTRDFTKYRELEVPADRRSPSTLVTDQVIDWVRERGHDRLFVFAHYYDVHGDYASLPEFERLFVGPYDGPIDGTATQLRQANLSEKHLALCRRDFDPATCRFGAGADVLELDADTTRLLLDERDARHLKDLYDAGIRQLDTELARLFGFLADEGLEEETLVVVTSDHGEAFLEHGQVAHYSTEFQELLHVPLILRGPGVPAGARVGAPVSLVDIVPTVLALVDAPTPSDLDGLDLAPLWRGADSSRFEDRFLYGEASGGLTHRMIVEDVIPIRRSVRRGRFKLQYESIGETISLYDLDVDPLEQVDVAAEHPEVTAALRGALDRRHAGPDTAAPGGGERVVLDPEEIERLRALGYAP